MSTSHMDHREHYPPYRCACSSSTDTLAPLGLTAPPNEPEHKGNGVETHDWLMMEQELLLTETGR